MTSKSSHPKITRRQLIKNISHFSLGVTGVFAAIGTDYHPPTLTKLIPLKDAAALADSNGNPDVN